MARKMMAEINRINKKIVEAKNIFIQEIKSGQVHKITCHLTYDPNKDLFNIRIANDILAQIISTWRAEEDPGVLDKISSFTRGWVNYLAIPVDNMDLLQNAAIIIELLLQEQILPAEEYGSLAFNLQSKFEEKIFNRFLV